MIQWTIEYPFWLHIAPLLLEADNWYDLLFMDIFIMQFSYDSMAYNDTISQKVRPSVLQRA